MAEETQDFSDLVPDQRVLVIWPNTDFVTTGHVLQKRDKEESYLIRFEDQGGKGVDRVFDFSGREKHRAGNTGHRLLPCPPDIDQPPREFYLRRINRCLLQPNLQFPEAALKAICDAIPESHV